MKSILITGVSGFVGSHLAKYFHLDGWSVFGIDRAPLPKAIAPFVADFLQTDIENVSQVHSYLRNKKVQVCLHAAASCLVEESTREPKIYMQNNADKPKKFFKAVRDCGVSKFIMSSTAAVYGNPQTETLAETHPLKPINPYGESKMVCEGHLQHMYEMRPNTCVGIFRYFNAAGSDPSAKFGEDHHPETHLIPNIWKKALGLSDSLHLYGDDFDTPDGTAVRDYVHVLDLALAHVRLANMFLHKHSHMGIYNLGAGQGYSLKQVLAKAQEIFNADIAFEQKPRRAGDPAILVANIEKAQKELGYQPKYSSLAQVLSSALQWQKKLALKTPAVA